MEIKPSVDLNKILHDLSTSSLSYKRHAAVNSLGKLTETSEEIVQALAGVIALDSDTDVRSAALQALQSPANQAFLKDRPDFLQEATKSAVDHRAREVRAEEEKTCAEFLNRRTRERTYYLLFIGGMFAAWILFFIGLVQEWMSQPLVRVWQAAFVGLAVLFFYKSWRNWRCPACDSWLGGFTAAINPIWSADSIRCPHCGKRLL